MAVSPQHVYDARLVLAEYKARRDAWQKRLDRLTIAPPGGISPYDHYKATFGTHEREEFKLRKERDAALNFKNIAASGEGKLVRKLRKAGLSPDANLAHVYKTVEDAHRSLTSLDHVIDGSPLVLGKSRFAVKLRKALDKGDYEKAAKLIHSRQLAGVTRFFKTSAGIAKHEAQIKALLAQVGEHKKATAHVASAEKAERLVEKHTAAAIHKMIKKDAEKGGFLINSSNKELQALKAAGNPAAELLLKFAPAHAPGLAAGVPDKHNILLALHKNHNISLFDVQNVMNTLNKGYATAHVAEKAKLEQARVKLKDCELFTKGCIQASAYETAHDTLKNRHDIIAVLNGVIAGAGTPHLTDDIAKGVIARARAEQKNWASAADIATVDADIAELATPATYSHASLKTSSLPSFNAVANVIHGTRETYKAAKSTVASAVAATQAYFAPAMP